ncbi:serine/threonine-protein phosphatase, partial [Streptomyces sp. SID7958]|nr:serine/threonine-protein phosphatase [Streptomyces sp. SID7958]
MAVWAVALVAFAGGGPVWLPLLAAGPALAAVTGGRHVVLGTGLLASVLGSAIGVHAG